MHNFKLIIALFIVFSTGCNDIDNHFYNDLELDKSNNQIKYDDIHQLNLEIADLRKTIDESGFSPILTTSFSLTNNQNKLWPQAWVAFIVNIYIKDNKLATMTESGSLHNHSLGVMINQALPKFGIKVTDIRIEVTPISWMPTYPLNITPIQ